MVYPRRGIERTVKPFDISLIAVTLLWASSVHCESLEELQRKLDDAKKEQTRRAGSAIKRSSDTKERNNDVDRRDAQKDPRVPPLAVVKNEDVVLEVARNGPLAIFKLELISKFSDDREATPYQKADFGALRFDVNQNGNVDSQLDVAYGQSGGKLCAQYLLTEKSSTGCGVFASKASLDSKFEGSIYVPRPHPIFLYTIPIAEITGSNEIASFVATVHIGSAGYKNLPASATPFGGFEKTIGVNLVTGAVVWQ